MNNMKIIEPSVELWEQPEDNIAHVAKCARVCYGRESGNDEILYKNLEKNKHTSMFRHETYYAAIPIINNYDLLYPAIDRYMHCPYINYVAFRDNLYIITNGNFIRDIEEDNPVLYKYIINHRISPKEAEQIEPIWKNFMRYTFCITTQISTSRELNRVSPNSISERSTRYVYEDGTICRPWWLTDDPVDYKQNKKINIYLDSCKYSFNNYKQLIDNCEMSRQDARGVLPLDTATKCVYTYSIDEWRHIIDLRYYGTTGKPHPNAKIIAEKIMDNLMDLGYGFRKI